MSLNEPYLDADAHTWSQVFFNPEINRKFIIPTYQRKYSWTETQVTEFWDDLNNEDDLFIGSVMIRRVDGNKREVIDGQQRFLNITMLCSIIRNHFILIGTPDSKSQANVIQSSCISRETISGSSINEEPYFVPGLSLQNIFKEHIQLKDGVPLNEHNLSNPTKEEVLIKEQYTFINNKVRELLSSKADKTSKQICLSQLWEKICKLRIILMEIENEIQAYEIFESINDKGINLNVGDLVKNAIFKSLHNDEIIDIEGKWEDIVLNVENSGITMIVFLKYYWGSKYTYVAEKRLYKAIKDKFATAQEWKQFFLELVDASEQVYHIKKGGYEDLRKYETNHKAQKSLYSNLRAFRTFTSDTWLVLMICIFRNRSSLPRMKKQYLQFERLTFIYYLMGLRSNTFHSKIYSFSKDLEKNVKEGASDVTINQEFTAFFQYIKDKINANSNEVFKEKFCELSYTEGSAYINYIFTEMMSSSPNMPATGWNNQIIEIEHILPQSPDEEWGLKASAVKPFVHKIGNLTLITQVANSSINNESYSLKLETYKTLIDYFPHMKDIVDNSNLNDDDNDKWKFDRITKSNYSCIEKRAEKLADDAWLYWKQFLVTNNN